MVRFRPIVDLTSTVKVSLKHADPTVGPKSTIVMRLVLSYCFCMPLVYCPKALACICCASGACSWCPPV